MPDIPASWRQWRRSAARLLLFSAVAVRMLPADSDPKSVTVGYNEYRPLVYSVPGQRPAGFVVQVLEEAARREQIQLRWVATSERPLDFVRSGKADIWPVYPTNAPDAKGLHVSTPWWRTEFSLIMRADTAVTDAASWSGVLAVQDYPTTLDAVRLLRKAKPTAFANVDDAVAAFCRGDAQGLLIGYSRAQTFLSRRPALCRDVPVEMAMLPDAGTDLSIVASAGSAEAADALRHAIDRMASDGTLLRISLQYPGIMPGMAVHLTRVAGMAAELRRRNETLTVLASALATVVLMAVVLWMDRQRRKRAEEALQASEDRLRLALVAASMRPWDWDEERDSIEDETERQRVERAVSAAIQNGSALEIEYRSGDRWILAKAHAAPFADRLTGMAMDVTDRKHAEQARAEVEERFRRAVLESPMPMMIYAGDGEVLNLSRSWTEVSGYSVEDIRTVESWNLQALQITEPAPQTGSQRIVTRRGEVRKWLLSRAPLGGLPDGRSLALLAAVDLTEHARVEEQLRRANMELEQYAYAAAHDLQEPMRIIGLYSQLLLRKHGPEFSETATAYFSTIVREAGRMTGIVNGLVSYSRLVSETDPPPLSAVPLGPVVQSVVEEMRPLLDARSAEVTVDSMPVVLAEPGSLMNVLRHLLSNAVTYVPADVAPKIRVFATKSGANWIVSVKDNGFGIAPEYHEKIWGVFKRLHGQEIPGTGIGLAVVRKVVQQHGGRVWVESLGPGEGSTFRFTLRAPAVYSGTAPDRVLAFRL